MNDEFYLIKCASGHETDVHVDDLREAFEFGTCPSPGCESEITSFAPSEIEVECLFCGWQELSEWHESSLWLWGGVCPQCNANSGGRGSVHIVGTHDYEVKAYEYHCESADIRPYLRETRGDYWELLVHYTSRDKFLKIMEQRQIVGSPTGLMKAMAVCLTETPVNFSSEFRSRYGPFGIVFRKGDLIRAGGGPALYILDHVIASQQAFGGFSPELAPFLNVLRLPSTAPPAKRAKRVDFLHEREWRFPGNILFSLLEPLAIIMPSGSTFDRFSGPNGKELLDIAWKYKEIR